MPVSLRRHIFCPPPPLLSPAFDWGAANLAEELSFFKRQFELALEDDGVTDLCRASVKLKRALGKEGLRRLDASGLKEERLVRPGPIWCVLQDQLCTQVNYRVHRLELSTYRIKSDETVDTFVNRCRVKAKKCQLTDQQISERIQELVIASTPIKSFQRELLAKDQTFTLEGLLQLGRRYEGIQAGTASLQTLETPATNVAVSANLDAVSHHGRKSFKYRKEDKRQAYSKGQSEVKGRSQHSKPAQQLCQNCGCSHQPRQCPAYRDECGFCHAKGHWKKFCKKRARLEKSQVVQEVHHQQDDDHHQQKDDAFLGSVHQVNSLKHWSAKVHVNGVETEFKIDTGADVTVLAEDCQVVQQHELTPPVVQRLTGPGETPLSVKGTLLSELSVDNKQFRETVYVVKGQRTSLLGKPACEALGLVSVSPSVYELSDSHPQPNFRAEFSQMFQGLGKFGTPYRIKLKDDSVEPLCLHVPRKVPYPLMPQVKAALERMVQLDVISPVTEPTTWCSGMVCVPKNSGSVRICVDLTRLNKAVHRESHPMSDVEASLAKLAGSKFYSKLDANSGFWQLPLSEESKSLTTFITPFGRYRFNRLPFGITSAPEIFQRTMSTILEGLPGVICHMDDILIHAATPAEHDQRVRMTMQRLQDNHVTLNDKCEFFKTKLRFLGNIVSAEGVSADPDKTKAIRAFPAPTNVSELQRFLGLVNEFSKFIPGYAEINQPLRQLLRKDNAWVWGPSQKQSFETIKDHLVSPAALAHYDPHRVTIVAADASAYGLGAVLLQIDANGDRRAVCHASRSLTETEQRYAVIDKEALAAVWACEKFSDYILGLPFELQTDHLPLVPLLSSKDLSNLPPRILRFRLRMMRYDATVCHVPGKQQVIADALSRAPVGKPEQTDLSFVCEVETQAAIAITSLPATDRRLHEIRNAQRTDPVCAEIIRCCTEGWPHYCPESPILKPYFPHRGNLTIVDDLLLYGERIVIPAALQLEVLGQIHQGHQGIVKCRARAKQSVWWPGLSNAIEQTVKQCRECCLAQPERKEPLMPSSFPERPWERVATDLFEHRKSKYVLVVDYYSRWVEVRKLDTTTSENVVNALKSIFAVHGIPEILMSDNGPQYVGKPFTDFAAQYMFTHVTSSPTYSQSNGEAERAVNTVKRMLTKGGDVYLSLLAYRSTPIQNGQSPSQMLMGRPLRTTLPMILPTTASASLRQTEQVYREKTAEHYNKAFGARPLSPLSLGDKVYIRDQQREGVVSANCAQPRSYVVSTEKGSLRRNRRSLIALPATPATETPTPREEQQPDPEADVTNQISPTQTPNADPSQVITRSGRVSKRPQKLDL